MKARFYKERYAHGWAIWDRETDTNDGYIYPEIEATAQVETLNFQASLEGQNAMKPAKE